MEIYLQLFCFSNPIVCMPCNKRGPRCVMDYESAPLHCKENIKCFLKWSLSLFAKVPFLSGILFEKCGCFCLYIEKELLKTDLHTQKELGYQTISHCARPQRVWALFLLYMHLSLITVPLPKSARHIHGPVGSCWSVQGLGSKGVQQLG